MVYETVRDRQQLVPGSIVWGYAFQRPDRRSNTQMRLLQKPVRSKVIDIDSRDYADTEEEAIKAYNEKIEWSIRNVKEELKELEEMKIGRL